MSAPLYKDQGKLANELLNKGFPSTDNFEFKIDGNLPPCNGCSFAPSVSKTHNGTVEGAVELKTNIKEFNLTTALNIKEELKLDISRNWPLGAIKAKLGLEVNSKVRELDQVKLKPSVIAQHDTFSATASINLQPFKSSFTSPLFSLLFVKNCFAFGGETELKNSSYSALNGVLSYTTPLLALTGYSKTKEGKEGIKSTKVGVTYHQKLANPNAAAVAAEISYDLDGSSKPVLSLGGSLKPEATTSLKARLNSKGSFGFGYSQNMSAPVTVHVCGELNLSELHAPNALRYGFRLAFN